MALTSEVVETPADEVMEIPADEIIGDSLPSRINGLTIELTSRALAAVADGKARRFREFEGESATEYAARAKEEIGIIRRVVVSHDKTKTVTERTSGGYVLWQVTAKRDRKPMAPAHLAKLRQGAADRKAKNAAAKAAADKGKTPKAS